MSRSSRPKKKAAAAKKNSTAASSAGGPSPFSEIGKRARDILTRDYNYEQKFTLSIPSSNGMELTATGVKTTATGVKKDKIFVGDLRTRYKSKNTNVNVNVDTCSKINISTKVSYDILPGTKAAISFKVPDQKSGKLDVCYLHRHATVNASIGLNLSPLLEASAAVGSRHVAIGGEIRFDTASSSFIKCNAGISLNKPDFSAALLLTDKGRTVKASYVHSVNQLPGTVVAVEMTHRLSSEPKNKYSIGIVHKVNPLTYFKSRYSENGKIGILCQHEWRPKSLVTVSAEYDTKATKATPKFGLAIVLKP